MTRVASCEMAALGLVVGRRDEEAGGRDEEAGRRDEEAGRRDVEAGRCVVEVERLTGVEVSRSGVNVCTVGLCVEGGDTPSGVVGGVRIAEEPAGAGTHSMRLRLFSTRSISWSCTWS